ncbi:uncharacterized protein A1O5_13088 [Cladophialophora psammophila CBS 110553]|uniref:Uncharacterized protein n=1 Tax=Cladophialophora psammophila CBS 110553 TaxID=1182543 RepID=W9VDF0_9EURO|nr:uncharacterized protein A1O5_13088 [Cladophialophora psammophila CBS 110553]EXJ53637.1 hypothetical protein A1O5_13088 [Cladophialophora psammophila CBS 110553]
MSRQPLILNHLTPHNQVELSPSPPTAPSGASWTIRYFNQAPNPQKLQKKPQSQIFTGELPIQGQNFAFPAHQVIFNGGGHFDAIAYLGRLGTGGPTTLRDGTSSTSIKGFLSFSVTLRAVRQPAPPPSTAAKPSSKFPPGHPLFDPDADDPEESQGPQLTPSQLSAQRRLNERVIELIRNRGLEPPALPSNPSRQDLFDQQVSRLLRKAGVPDLPPGIPDSLVYEERIAALLEAADIHNGQGQGHSQAATPSHFAVQSHPAAPSQFTAQSHLAGASHQLYSAEGFGEEENEEGYGGFVHEEEPEHFPTHEEEEDEEHGEFEGEDEGEGEWEAEGEGHWQE